MPTSGAETELNFKCTTKNRSLSNGIKIVTEFKRLMAILRSQTSEFKSVTEKNRRTFSPPPLSTPGGARSPSPTILGLVREVRAPHYFCTSKTFSDPTYSFVTRSAKRLGENTLRLNPITSELLERLPLNLKCRLATELPSKLWDFGRIV